jgi:hypothetical protein
MRGSTNAFAAPFCQAVKRTPVSIETKKEWTNPLQRDLFDRIAIALAAPIARSGRRRALQALAAVVTGGALNALACRTS